MRRSYLWTPLLLTFLTAACAGGMAGSRTAPHVWPADFTIDYEAVQVQGMTMEIPGMGGMTTTTTSTVVFRVVPVGARTFDLTVTDARIDIDSAMPMEGQDMPDISALKGLTSTITLGEDGVIQTATGLTENSAIADMGGEASFRESMQSLFLPLPEGALEVGTKWSRESRFEANQSGMEMAFLSTSDYECVGETIIDGTAAWEIKETGKVSLVGGGDQMGVMIDMDAAGDGTGTFFVEKGTARLIRYEGKGTLAGGVSAQGMDIPLSMVQTATVNVKR